MSGKIEAGQQWVSKAKSDLLNADNNLGSDEVPFDTVCFHCQQAAEKFLKAYLVVNSIQPPISHDLLLILEKVCLLEPHAESLRDDLFLLLPYAVEIRYPDDWFMPSEEDAREAREAAAKVMAWLQKMMPELFCRQESPAIDSRKVYNKIETHHNP